MQSDDEIREQFEKEFLSGSKVKLERLGDGYKFIVAHQAWINYLTGYLSALEYMKGKQ